jgi:uncharacterized protein (TIRG00374 family)
MYCNQWKPYKTLFKAVVSLGLLIWLGYSIQWQELGQILLDIKLYWLTVALGWIIVSMIISTYKWQMVLKAQGFNLDWVKLWKVYWAGIFMNNFLPSSIGGDALRIYRINEMTGSVSAATASVLMERVLAISGIALVGMAGAIATGRTGDGVWLLFIILLLVTIFLTVLLLSHFSFKWKRVRRLAQFLEGMADQGKSFRMNWPKLGAVVALSILFQITVVGVNYSIFLAFNLTSLGWWDACYLIPVTSAIAMIPVSINGYGVREGAYVALLAGYQVSSTIAFSSSLLFAFLVSLCSLYGGIVILRHNGQGDINNGYQKGFANSR